MPTHRGRGAEKATRAGAPAPARSLLHLTSPMLAHQRLRFPDLLGLVLGSMSRWPRRVLDGFGYFAYVVVYRIVRWRRQLSATNIANAFPDKTAAEREAILTQSYRNLGRFLAEAL